MFFQKDQTFQIHNMMLRICYENLVKGIIQSMHANMIVHYFERRMSLLVNVQCAMSLNISYVMVKEKIPQKVLRHFPIKPRLQMLFMLRHTSINMRWHKEKRINEDGVLRHPNDSRAWKDMNTQFPWFSQGPHNVQLGLATYGFNPFGTMSISYSMWLVVLVPYNMPPWRCMKEMFFNLSLLITRQQAPGKDIDVYLCPLIEELKELWYEGVQTFDVSIGKNFCMHACVLWTINGFPSYRNLFV